MASGQRAIQSASGLFGWFQKITNFVDGNKAALEKGNSAASSAARNSADEEIKERLGKGEVISPAEESLIRNRHDKTSKAALSEVSDGLAKGGTKKAALWGAGIVGVGTALATTGLGKDLLTGGFTMWETSQRQTGVNATFYGIFAFLKKAMEVLGLDKKMPGAHSWLEGQMKKSTPEGAVPDVLGGAEKIVPDFLDQNNGAIATAELAAAAGVGIYGASKLMTPKPGINGGGGPSGPSTPPSGGGPNGGGTPSNSGGGNSTPQAKGKWGRLFGFAATGVAAATVLGGEAEADTPNGSVSQEAELANLSTNAGMGVMTAVTAAETSKGAGIISKNIGEIVAQPAGKAGGKIAEEALEGGLKLFGKRIPIIGGVVTLGFSAASAWGSIQEGNFTKAGTELVTGVAEAAVNTTGLGLIGGGDLAREGLRGTFALAVGESNTADKSGIRSLVEWGTKTGDFRPGGAFA